MNIRTYPVFGQTEHTHADLRDGDGKRGAHIYPVHGDTVFRIRLQKYPDHNTSGLWRGGQVLWNHDQPSLAEAIEVARQWVEHAVMPTGG